jgi:hypothetical protein
MHLNRLFGLLLIGCSILTGHSSSASTSDKITLSIGMLDMGEPLAYSDSGNASGIYVDLIRAIADASGYDAHIKLLPYQRIFTPAIWQQQDLALSFRAGKSDYTGPLSRLTCFDEALFRSRLNIYGLSKSERKNPTLATIIPVELSKHENIVGIIGGKSLNIIRRINVEAMFKSLLSKRVDYIATAEISNYYWSQKFQIPPLTAFANLTDVESFFCYPQERNNKTSVAQFKHFMESMTDEELSILVYPLLDSYRLPRHFISYFSPNFPSNLPSNLPSESGL